MTSKLKVNNIEDSSGNALISKCGSTLTLGKSGDTISLASGASQSGFGRTGTVDWQTSSIKTATFTAESGKGYFCNTSGGAFEMDLPAGSAGAIVSVQDYNNTFDTHALTVDPNGSEKINGGSAGDTVLLNTEGLGITFVYIDATVGWRSVHSNEYATVGSNFVTATGGTITTEGNYKIHTFTSPGTFCVSAISSSSDCNKADYLIVGGGGAGAGLKSTSHGAGGGAGGFRASNDTCMAAPFTSPLASPTGVTLSVQGYPITVGAGATGPTVSGGPVNYVPGSNSSALGLSSQGGGGGGNASGPPAFDGGPGGSGGGAAGGSGSGGSGNTPPVSPPQGNAGGDPSHNAPGYGTGGGGGAGAVGGNGSNPSGGVGGVGSYMVATGFAGSNGTTGPVPGTRYFAGGGSGSTYQGGTVSGPPAGGGGEGLSTPVGNPVPGNGTANTGGGGGGKSESSGTSGGCGGNGGSGIVIIRYKYQ